jgi:poly(3-hydroxybutyrate) depolymerase
MKISLTLLLIGITLLSNAQFIELPTTDPNPGHLKAKIHLSSKKTSEALPLVVVLHGCYQDPEKIAHDADWNRLVSRTIIAQQFIHLLQLVHRKRH